MTEDEKFLEVFRDMQQNPRNWTIVRTPGGVLYEHGNVLVGRCGNKWDLQPRGVPGAQSIEIPSLYWGILKSGAEAIEEAGRQKTRSLDSFLKRR